ncbi:MAG TPA: response regulator transcription factor [Denitromonas sp.]|uniref:response regulator transcription factor n=1 Tax=Denitromonas sp. TaxID=2734609 RepID=UPI001E07008E|nr:response regulator transcription factor [Rhodocyclaceae bacterium]MCP5220276.1 response regulator transcription factor [Zoogloeaceae bacterium]HPR05315.1 response regulator transcription factor [Denitromonas sp.]HQU87344.1 response regulator transcription factor [Denitromonas sp.]HQV13678.1 response regulator transcription factor [Denitromonas sp.]
MTERIRVLLVDDHGLFRSGIKSLLKRSDEFEVVGEAADGLEGAKRAKQLAPDVVLLDLHMPGVGGQDALKLILEDVPNTHVLMLTVSEDSEDLLTTLRSGATGYLLKNIEAETLIDAIRMASRGEPVISPLMMGKLLANRTPGGASASSPTVADTELDKLTPREREILGCIAKGQSNKQIARNLEVAESTVKIHVQSVLKKLHLSSRVQAAVFAVERGFAAQ